MSPMVEMPRQVDVLFAKVHLPTDFHRQYTPCGRLTLRFIAGTASLPGLRTEKFPRGAHRNRCTSYCRRLLVVITARSVMFIFLFSTFFNQLRTAKKQYHFVRFPLFTNMIFYISYKYHIYEYCIFGNIR